MIAEFLYRSAMYLGHPQGDTLWLPDFREDKRFSGNTGRTESVEPNDHTSVMSALGTSSHCIGKTAAYRVQSQDSHGKHRFRGALSGWLHKHRRQHSKDSNNALKEEPVSNKHDDVDGEEERAPARFVT
ncbi:hypothetical protein GQ600_2133 [Phytophthora cactorum]|nr:hypothetical protein GQ600_2133 [Phytophthora cactorum]